MTTPRHAIVARQTAETKIDLDLHLDGSGMSKIATGVGFLDHMLELFARHACLDLAVSATGDLHVDPHHTVEDVGICLGKAIDQAVGNKQGIQRFGNATVPMDESLVTTTIDLSGRPYLVFNAELPSPKIGEFDSELIEDFWQAITSNANCNLHINLHYGRNSHHISEAIFKSAARALRAALERDPRTPGIPSTKGTLDG